MPSVRPAIAGRLAALVLVLLPATALAKPLHGPVQALISVCFTPGENCDGAIAQAIASATHEIDVQAYGFTDTKILRALRAAIGRRVKVHVVLDKVNREKRYSGAHYMQLAGADVWIDSEPAIAHNKIIIIDHHLVIGGSFNYTLSAQRRNAENVTFSESSALAAIFYANWLWRKNVSEPYQPPD